MKKITLCAFALAAISLASCKKERTCSCTGTTTVVTTVGSAAPVTVTGNPDTTTEVLASATSKTAKGKKTCNSRIEKKTSSGTNGGITTTSESSTDYSCTIK